MSTEESGFCASAEKMAGKKPSKTPKLDTAENEGAGVEEQEQGEEQQQMLEKVVGVQNEIDRLNEQASEEILHVEQKYNKLRKPCYERRSELIKSVPDFWLSTLLNCSQFAELLDEEDETVLQYLENITVDEFEDVKSGYKISFYFRPNPYFENSVLSKEFVLDSLGESKVVGTEISWKPGKDLTNRPAPAETKGRKRPHEEPQSFFCWFTDVDPSNNDGPAEIIKDDIWPNPLQYFLPGDLSVDAGDGYEEDEEEEEGLEEEELDEDLEEEEEEEETVDLVDEEDEEEEEEEEEDDEG